jgi:hypothetical protein
MAASGVYCSLLLSPPACSTSLVDNTEECYTTGIMGKTSTSFPFIFFAMSLTFSVPGSTNDLLDLEIEAARTQFEADSTAKAAFATLFDGDRWMIYYNTVNQTLHWDFSAEGRFISFPVADNQ